MFPRFRPLWPLGLLGGLALAWGCSSTQASESMRDQISSLVRYGRIQEARDLAQERLGQYPDDPDAQRDLRDTEVALLLDKGTDQLYLDRIGRALEYFYRALELAPENQVVQSWVQKANVQIAEDSLTLAANINERKDPVAKVLALQKVLSHLPLEGAGERIQKLRDSAIRGLITVQMFQAYERGGTYSAYQDGLRDLNRSLLARDLAEELRSTVTNTLEGIVSGVERRFIQATRYEQEDLLLAARFQYQVVLSLEPGHQAALAALERIQPQLKGLELGVLNLPLELELEPPMAPMTSHRETSAPQESMLEPMTEPLPAQSPSQLEDPSQSRAPATDPLLSREAKLAELYASARALETAGELPASIEVYDEIGRLEAAYRDVAERRETLAEFVIQAESLYTEAMDSDDEAHALRALMSIAAFWPSYRDVQAQIKSRKAAVDSGEKDPEDSN